MKLDELINEANYSFMNKYINTSEPKKGLDLFAYENARQERIEKQIEKLRAEKEELKAKGKIEEAKLVIKKIKELKVKLGQSDVGSEADSNEKNKGTDNVAKLKIINTLKGKICFLMMNYANLTSGIGLNGDKSLTNAVKVVKTKKDDEGKQELKVVGAPTTAQLTQHYNALKDAVEQLKKYEYGYYEGEKYIYGAPRRYFDNKMDRSKVLLKALEEIKPSEISFDPDSIETPISTDSTLVKTGADIERNGKKTGERYAEIKPLKTDSNGNIKTNLSQIKMAKVLGKKRFNAFVYEALQPYIHEFQKYRKDWDTVKHPENINLDFIAKDVKGNLEARTKKANEIASDSKKKFSEFKKLRKSEQELGNISAAKDESKGEDGKIDHAMYSAKQQAGKTALRKTYAKEANTETGERAKTGNQGWLEAHHIEKLNLTKIKKIIDGWIANKQEPNADEKRIIKFFGSMPGSGGSTGAGTLIFMHTDKPVEGQFSYDGLYAFKAGKKFMNGDLSIAQEKYVENHAGRKADEWKKGVLKALEKYDASIQTEEVINYFNY